MELIKIWLLLVDITPIKGFNFKELINDEETSKIENHYDGAWANILIKAVDIDEVIKILPAGLKEKNFQIKFIDKIENMQSYHDNIDDEEDSFVDEAKWLFKSNYVFKIIDPIFPYDNSLED